MTNEELKIKYAEIQNEKIEKIQAKPAKSGKMEMRAERISELKSMIEFSKGFEGTHSNDQIAIVLIDDYSSKKMVENRK